MLDIERLLAAPHGTPLSELADRDPPVVLPGVDQDEDLARLSGSLKAKTVAERSVRRRFLRRIPWLLIGLAGAMVSAGIVKHARGSRLAGPSAGRSPLIVRA
ncbi:hypothetical protein ACIHFD_57060 [Nonomuraea sp. NPDC051941]|uniref:hypothetical protein n=1 Tax=Nonomuraea sp. NPDC051941 TaxID=3364373 RepID=UPI0037C52099